MKIISYIKIISCLFSIIVAIRGCYIIYIKLCYPDLLDSVSDINFAIIYLINFALVPFHFIDTSKPEKELDIMDHLIE